MLEEEKGEETEKLSLFDEFEIRLPTSSEQDDCQEYNHYCWGLEDNPDSPAPYIIGNVEEHKVASRDDDSRNNNGNIELFLRYVSRDVFYL